MTPQKFFQQLKTKLSKNNFQERFIQELQDHLEDATTEKILKGALPKKAKEMSIVNLGEPEKIAENFNRMTYDGSLLVMYLEGLLLGILSIPLYLNSIEFTNLLPTESFEIGGKIMSFLFLVLFIIGGSFIFYSFAFSRFFSAASNRKNIYWGSYLLALFGPPISTYTSILILNWNSPDLNLEGRLLSTICYYIPLFIGIFSYYLNYNGIQGLAERSITKTTTQKKWWLFFIIYIAIAYSFRYSLPESMFNSSPLSILLIPIMAFETFATFMGRLFTFPATGYFHIISGYWIVGFMLSLISALCLTKIVITLYKKYWQKENVKFSLACFFLLSIIIPQLFFPPIQKAKIKWQVETSNLSETMERKETWPFYSFIAYNIRWQSYPLAFVYQTYGTEKNSPNSSAEFFIHQYTNEFFALSNIQSTTNYQLKKLEFSEMSKSEQQSYIPNYPEKTAKLPDKFACEHPPIHLDGDIPSTPCSTLKYKNQIIYKAEAPLFLYDLTLSHDQTYALITLSDNEWNGANKLYLIKLEEKNI